MATAVRISEELVDEAKRFSRIDHRSLAGQIEHWARMGKCAEENPDLSYTLIKEILMGLDELDENEKTGSGNTPVRPLRRRRMQQTRVSMPGEPLWFVRRKDQH